MIAVQVIINIGVVIGMFPVTGITLPLISAGGSSLTLMLTSIGVLLNISRYAR
jgi:cell division protein FtsW